MESRSILKGIAIFAVVVIVCFVLYEVIIIVLGIGDFLFWWTDDLANWFNSNIWMPLDDVANGIYTGIQQGFVSFADATGVQIDGIKTNAEVLVEGIANGLEATVTGIADFFNNLGNLIPWIP